MANKVLNVPVIEKEFEDQLTTKLDMNQFLNIDDSLTRNEGDTVKIVRYSGVNGVEKLAMGEGNTEAMEVNKTVHDYTVECFQGKFPYYDEEMMTDGACIEKGINYMSESMINRMTALTVAEFLKTSNVLYDADWTYANVVDAIAMLDIEGIDGFFMLINPKQRAAFQKNLNDNLKYVEPFVRTGYIGSVNGVPVYTSKAIPAGKAIIASKKAVTSFLKSGVVYESERNADTRKNTMYIRKYGVVALTDDRYCVVLDSAAAPADFTALTKNTGAEVVVDGHGVKVTGDAVIAGVPADYASLFTLPTNKDIVVELDGIIPADVTTTIVQTNPALKPYYEAGDATIKKVGNSYVKTETYDGSDTDLAVLVREGKKVNLVIGDNNFTVDGTFTLAE